MPRNSHADLPCILTVLITLWYVAAISTPWSLPKWSILFRCVVSLRILRSVSLSKSFDNDTERSIRDMVMGKKAYLLCQNDLSCYHAAEMYSFFGACKVLGKNPAHWLTYALKHIKSCPKDRMKELLPENWMDDTI